jgi:Zn-dependent protease/CBS domain-containing protein
MRWSLTIGRIGGTAVRVHLTFVLFLAWIGFSAWQHEGAVAARSSVVFIVLIFACVVLHEFGHIFAARQFGIETPEVTLLPIGGVASMQRMPKKPAQELAVAIAGPMVNVVIAVILLVALGKIDPDHLARLNDTHVSLLARLAAANVFLVVFNMIPAFPMDGGRVLRALLAMKLGAPRATRIAASIGQGFAFVLGFLGLFGNPLLLFIAIFVYVAAAGEAQMTAFHESARGLGVIDAMETRFTPIPANARLSEAVDTLLATAQHEFAVVDAFGKPVGLLARENILSALKEHDREAAIADFMRATIRTISPAMPLEEALDQLYRQGASALCVTDRDGVLVGLLTRENVAEMMMIKSLRPDWRFDRQRASTISAE